jgi:hypothetical protein
MARSDRLVLQCCLVRGSSNNQRGGNAERKRGNDHADGWLQVLQTERTLKKSNTTLGMHRKNLQSFFQNGQY